MISNRLVQDCSQIMLLLLHGKSSVNDIIRQTGIYKNNVFEANRFLEQSRLVVRGPNKEIHKQKIFIELTKLGRRLGEFINSTDIFDRSFEALKLLIKNKFNIRTEGNALRSLLRERGWSDEEIKQYPEYDECINSMETDCLSVIIDGIKNIYGRFLLQFKPNKLATELLEKIIINDRLSKYLLSQIKSTVSHQSVKCESCGAENSLGAAELMEESCEALFSGSLLADYVHIPFNLKVATREVKDILKSLVLVMDIPREYVKDKAEKELKILNSCDPNNANVVSKKRLISYYAN